MMTLPVPECTAAIRRHTHGLAAAAEGNLEARIEHCPEWSMADLVWHLIGVHSFWNLVATTLPAEQPAERPDSERPADDALIPDLLAGMERLIATLEAADQDAPCWTWGLQENVGFITRHQVQEAAVHHWDAVNAAGRTDWKMDEHAALDAVEEFLTHSVANTRWPMPDVEPLGGELTLAVASPAPGASITVSDGPAGTLVHSVGTGDGTGVDPGDLLLWLFQRKPDLVVADPDLIQRFRGFTFTD